MTPDSPRCSRRSASASRRFAPATTATGLTSDDVGQLAVLYQLARPGTPCSIPSMFIGLTCPITLHATISPDFSTYCRRRSSERNGDARIDCPATTARDISSRSANVSANLDRHRCAGRIPPVAARICMIEEWLRPNSWQSFEAILPASVAPNQCLLAVRVIDSRSLLHVNTPPAYAVSLECCVHQLNPHE